MRPQVSPDSAIAMAQQHWHLAGPLSCSQLDGYDDTNYKLSGPGGHWVLKAHNCADSQPEARFPEAQNELLGLLTAAGFRVPLALPVAHAGDADGATVRIRAEDGRLHAVRLLTWLPGTLMVDVPQSPALYQELGCLLGRVDRCLQGSGLAERFPSLRRKFDWNLMCLAATYARVRPDLLHWEAVDVDLLDQVVTLFQRATNLGGERLRRCIIHSDANERNVLVHAAAAAAAATAAGMGARDRQPGVHGNNDKSARSTVSTAADLAAAQGAALITGLIDWGDACEQWLAAEPAAACVYVMLLDANIGDPLPAAAALLHGYERELALLPEERRLLRTLAMGRLALSLSLGAHSAAQQPNNAAYLLSTQRNGWRLLRLLTGMSDEEFLQAGTSAPP